MRLRRLVYVGSLILLLFFIQEGSPTLMLTSLLMALKGGIMVGKMSLGGLMMMLNAAQNEQRSTGRTSIFGTKAPSAFDILSLMSTSHSTNVPVSLSTSVPPKVTSTTTSGTLSPNRLAKRRIIKKKIKVKRDINGNNSTAETAQQNLTMIKTVNEEPLEEKEIQTRIYRQISNLDPLMCLPKVMCGINSAPPSTKTTILNDYAYLMKTIFARDDDKDGKKPVDGKNKEKSKKKGSKNKDSDKNDDNVTDETQEEEFALNDEDFERLALKEEDDIENLANDEMVDEEPGFLPFILKDVSVHAKRPSNPDYPSDDLNYYGGLDEDGFVTRPSPYEMSRRPPPPMMHKHSGETKPPQSTGSLLSSFIPKIAFGKNKEGQNDVFSNDPFFEGFKRSMKTVNLESENKNSGAITKEQEKILNDIAIKRDKRNAYVQRKKKQLEMATDPEEKFRIAAEVGQKTKSARQCRAVFDGCPFRYTEVLNMINNLRKAIQGHPEVSASTDKVVNLQSTGGTQTQQFVTPSKNIINVATANGAAGHGGITSISHQLPNGETVEINLKLLGQPTAATSTSTSTTIPVTEKVRPSKMPQTRPNDKETIFDDDEAIIAQASSQPYDVSTVQSMRDRIHSIESLESLKATILAIEKINNATLNRKKYGKPITYSGVFHEVTGLIPSKKKKVHDNDDAPVNDSVGSSSESDETDDEVDEDLPVVKPHEAQTPNKKPETKKPLPLRPELNINRPVVPNPNRPRPHQDGQRPQRPTQNGVRPNRPQDFQDSTTPRIPATTSKRVIQYKTRKPTGPSAVLVSNSQNSSNKVTKVAQKPHAGGIVPFTEKENVKNPAKLKQPTQHLQRPKTPPNASKERPSENKDEQKEDYDEDDVDGDDNDNDTSEEEEDEENDGDGDNEERLNIGSVQSDSQEDDEDTNVSTRIVIKPSMTGPAPPHGQGHPPHGQGHPPHGQGHPPHGQGHPPSHGQGHPPPHGQGHPPHGQGHPPHGQGHPPPHGQGHPPHPHSQGHHHSEQMPPQRHSHVPPSKFLRRTFQVSYKKRARSVDNDEPTPEVKPKHPNHRYPCGVETTTSTEKLNEEVPVTEIPVVTSSTTSTLAPPTLPIRYPKYASPHNPYANAN